MCLISNLKNKKSVSPCALSRREKWQQLEEALVNLCKDCVKANSTMDCYESDKLSRNDYFNQTVKIVNSWGHNLQGVIITEDDLSDALMSLIDVLREEELLEVYEKPLLRAVSFM